MATAAQDNTTANQFNWGKAIIAGLAGVVSAGVSAFIYAVIANALAGPAIIPQGPEMVPGPLPAVMYGVAGAMFTIVGAIIFVLMMRFGGEKAIRNFIIVGVIGWLLSHVTVFNPQITLDTQSALVLIISHAVAAVAAIPAMVMTYQRN